MAENSKTKEELLIRKCPSCGNSINITEKICSYCELAGYKCPVCGEVNNMFVNYCRRCGQWLLDTNYKALPVRKKDIKNFEDFLTSILLYLIILLIVLVIISGKFL